MNIPKEIEFIERLDNNTILAIFHMLIKKRGNYSNNLTNKELIQYNYLINWYSENFREV